VGQLVNEHPGDADVLDVGGRWPRDSLRRQRAGLVVAALLFGLVTGYLAGHTQTGVQPRAHPAASAIVPSATALADTGYRCAVRDGADLQLGMEVTNQSGLPLTLGRVTAVLPLGGLRPVSTQAGSCGLLAGGGYPPAQSVAPGATGWLTVTFAVLVSCPQPLPVQFTVSYVQHGHPVTARFAGFPDLGDIRYGHCGAS
jgi:hypothetical protein